ncbi:hypothetical protein CJ030_MR5G010484 [Morella rubra]|uniref:Uncharacterized protein n=1 Tax=Morella rubra TaxID=262757 RepID=A0A6A1VLE1_9ROSI|nr:hypothetical protein CJ030_MR5G010484 [Morella rubra]
MEHLSGALHISKLENAINAGEASLNDKKNLHKLVLDRSGRDVSNVQGLKTRVLSPQSKDEILLLLNRSLEGQKEE